MTFEPRGHLNLIRTSSSKMFGGMGGVRDFVNSAGKKRLGRGLWQIQELVHLWGDEAMAQVGVRPRVPSAGSS